MPPDDYIGKILAKKYRVDALLGEGGMGKVYKATQVVLEKPVVLKVLRQALLSDERTVARFQREAKAASRLNHANSISILDFGQADDGAMYIAMEYVSGKDLHQILSHEWPLSESRVVRILAQVLSALADAHSAGVIHRDLKPENIMVEQRRGEPDFVKVLDFGIAKISDASGEDGPALTRVGFVCGTPEYMSPEQARGATLDHRSDLYAVGVILYQLTTGLLPFEAESAVGFATKHLTEPPPLPSRRRPEAKISLAMEQLIMKSLAKAPEDRPQTAEAFRAELLAVDKLRRSNPALRQSAIRKAIDVPWPEPFPEQEPTHVLKDSQNFKGPQKDPGWGLDTTDTIKDSSKRTVRAGQPPQKGAPTAWAKAAVGAFVLLTASAAGFFAYRGLLQRPLVADVPATVAGHHRVESARLWDQQILPSGRATAAAAALADEGDVAWEKGDWVNAIAKYEEAFSRDPLPGTALKLGELYFQRDDLEGAKGWWTRHLADAPQSKARDYIDRRLGE